MLKWFCDGCSREMKAEEVQASAAAAESLRVASQQVFCKRCLPGAPGYWSGPYADLQRELRDLTEARLKNTARDYFKSLPKNLELLKTESA